MFTENTTEVSEFYTDCLVISTLVRNPALSLFTFMHWRRKWQPPPVLLPGESQGGRSLVGYSPWGRRVRHDWTTSVFGLERLVNYYEVTTFLISTIQTGKAGVLQSMGSQIGGHKQQSSKICTVSATPKPFHIPHPNCSSCLPSNVTTILMFILILPLLLLLRFWHPSLTP